MGGGGGSIYFCWSHLLCEGQLGTYQFHDENDEVRDDRHGADARNIPRDQPEGVLGRPTKGRAEDRHLETKTRRVSGAEGGKGKQWREGKGGKTAGFPHYYIWPLYVFVGFPINRLLFRVCFYHRLLQGGRP